MSKLALLCLLLAATASAQTEPYISASVADFSKAGYEKPYWDAGLGLEANGEHVLFRADGYYSPTKKQFVPGSATTFGGTADLFYRTPKFGVYKDNAVLIGAGVTGGQTRTSEFVSHGFRGIAEIGYEAGEPKDPYGRVRIIGRYEWPINDPHALSEEGLTVSARFKHFEPYVSLTSFTADVTGRQYAAQLGLKWFPWGAR